VTPTPLVLHVTLSLNPGGAERLVIDLCKELRRRFRVAVCCLDEFGTWADQLTGVGIDVARLGRAPGFQLGLVRRLAQLARQQGASLLHCHQYTPFVYGLLASRLSSTAVVYTEHGRLTDTEPTLKRRIANRALRLLPFHGYAVSCELRADLIRAGFPASRVGVIRNGVSVTPADALLSQYEARARLGVPRDAFIVGTIARLDPVKNLATLIEGVARLRVPVHLVVVGDGPERARLEQLAAGLGVQATFAGAIAEARRILPAFDVFANTSLTEGISVTILEAMDARVPIVATRVGGTAEVLEDGRTAYLVPARSPDAVASALRELASQPARRSEIVLESKFSLASMIDKYIAAYGEALASTPRRQRAVVNPF
jgi:glycosyltransferase involved in cell wall biosynthesis